MNPIRLSVLSTLVAATAALTSAQAPGEDTVRRDAARALGLAESNVLIDTIGSRHVDGLGVGPFTRLRR